MPRETLATDAVVQDLIKKLDNPDKYLRYLYWNMSKYKDVHGSVFVVIGTSGRGHHPHYRLRPDQETLTRELDNQFAPFLGEVPDPNIPTLETTKIFDGKTHKQLDHQEARMGKSGELNWSTKSSSFEEIEKVFSEFRERNKK